MRQSRLAPEPGHIICEFARASLEYHDAAAVADFQIALFLEMMVISPLLLGAASLLAGYGHADFRHAYSDHLYSPSFQFDYGIIGHYRDAQIFTPPPLLAATFTICCLRIERVYRRSDAFAAAADEMNSRALLISKHSPHFRYSLRPQKHLLSHDASEEATPLL